MTLPAPASPAELDLDALNRAFESATPQDILRWAIKTFPTGLAQTSSFSIPVTLHMLYKELCPKQPVPVIFLDTLHHFPETLETVERAVERYDLNLHVYQAQGADSREEFVARYGSELWRRDIDRFHHLTKVEPLQRALEGISVKAWVTGRRRDQSATRRNMPILEEDSDGRLKINPLANWTQKDLWTYVYYNDVIYNPLHDKGYASIGDEPLTTPVQAGEPERAGRWRGSAKTECGIHI
ncbi:phosphoadenosine phosphosulfate reductase [Oscillatoria sp. CS-180]|nr:phosphoadenosine phosphosulfate reductase [Oscillatoria sp. CS-180]